MAAPTLARHGKGPETTIFLFDLVARLDLSWNAGKVGTDGGDSDRDGSYPGTDGRRMKRKMHAMKA